MIYLILIATELILLFLLSHRIHTAIYLLFFTLTRSRHFATGMLTLILLPGTIIHELSHWIIAEILRVPTGEISLAPEIIKNGNKQEIKAGSVQIAQTDPIRRLLIGLAPFFVGIFFLGLIIWIYQVYVLPLADFNFRVLLSLGLGYLIFTISNSMFSSQKDLEGWFMVVPIFVLIGLGIYFFDIRLSIAPQRLLSFLPLLQLLTMALSIVVGINIFILLLHRVLLQIIWKLTGRRVI